MYSGTVNIAVEILQKIVFALGQNLSQAIILLLSCVEGLVGLAGRILDRKEKKEKEKKAEDSNKDLKDICDNGTLNDLINGKHVILIVFLGFLCQGCFSGKPEIEVNAVKSWEGHYMSVEDFHEKTKDISLERDEPIWVLSNRTLYNILKDRNGN